MKLYITKPRHTRYGHMKIDNPYKTIDELINNSSIWFMKPNFLKPNICMFEGTVVWNGYRNHGYHSSSVVFSSFPEGPVKEKIKQMISESIDDNFQESRHNRYYKWIGEVDVTLTERTTSGNFNLYLTKALASQITFAGIDYCPIWLEPPTYSRININTGLSQYYQYQLIKKNNPHEYIAGKIFRKTPELQDITAKMWDSIVSSFDVKFNDMNEFYMAINDKNHKKGMSVRQFVKPFFFDLTLTIDKQT